MNKSSGTTTPLPSATDQQAPAEKKNSVSSNLARPGGLSYLHIPSSNVSESSRFYETVFEWKIRRDSDHDHRFEDQTGHLIGRWSTDLPVSPDAGFFPYIYVNDVEETLNRVHESGGKIEKPPYPEGNLQVAVIRDPAGNKIGIWQC